MNWYNKIKLSFRGNTPRAFDLDEKSRDPYKKDPQMTAGDEEIGGGLGSRFRGKNMPKDFGGDSEEEYSAQKETDIPVSDHIFDEMPNEGIPPGELADPEDPISRNRRIMEQLDHPGKEPVGIHNMNSNKVIPGSPKPNSIFDNILKNQKR